MSIPTKSSTASNTTAPVTKKTTIEIESNEDDQVNVVEPDFDPESTAAATVEWSKLSNNDRRALETKGLNAQDYYSLITPGEYLTDAVLRVSMRLINKIDDFKVYSDCLGLQQAGMLPVMQINTGVALHVGGNHFIAATRTNRTTIDVYDSLNPRQISHETRNNLNQMKAPDVNGGNINDVTEQCEFECGVKSVSFLTCRAYGLDPSSFEIINGIDRQHLAKCLIAGEMTMFPARACSGRSQTRFTI